MCEKSRLGERRGSLHVSIVVVVGLVTLAIVVASRITPDTLLRPALAELQRSAGVEVRYESSRFGWGTVILDAVEIVRAGHASPARLAELTLRPSLWGLLTGSGGIPLRAQSELYGGTADATLEGRPGDWRGALRWQSLDIAELGALGGTTEITGRTTGQIDTTQVGGTDTTDGAWDISGADIVAIGLRSGRLEFPPIRVSELHSAGTWAGRTATVSSLAAEASLGSIALTGKIVLREPVEQSALKMQLRHTPPQKVTGNLALLMKTLLPPGATERAGTYRVGGTLAMPTLTPIASP